MPELKRRGDARQINRGPSGSHEHLINARSGMFMNV